MDTSHGSREKMELARKRMIEEGAVCYLDARVALKEFCSEVQNRCREVLKSRLPDLRKLTNLKLDEDRIELAECPPEPSLEWASLGANLQLKDHHLTILVTVQWGSEQDKSLTVSAAATIYTRSKLQFNRAWPKFKTSRAEKYDDHEIYFEETLPPGGIGEFHETLGKMLGKLIRAWKAAGGLKAFSG